MATKKKTSRDKFIERNVKALSTLVDAHVTNASAKVIDCRTCDALITDTLKRAIAYGKRSVTK